MVLLSLRTASEAKQSFAVIFDVGTGRPVFLTKNGRGRFAIVDIDDYEKTQAMLELLTELAKGKKSGEEKGWLPASEIEKALGLNFN